MPAKIQWTKEQDDTIVALRAAGKSWTAVGREVGVSQVTTMDHAFRVGLEVKPVKLFKGRR